MRTAGIIAEYNPFHKGHRYHIEQARNLTGADFIIAAISGDFVQRGTPAVFDKYERTRMALLCGVDLVIELPSIFASGSAEDFASCGVALFNRLGVTDFLVFGSECGSTDQLLKASSILVQEPDLFSSSLKEHLRQGMAFPAAVEKALTTYMATVGTDSGSINLSSPNNILGIEYCKALIRQNSSIKPVSIKRLGDYHDASLVSKKPEGFQKIRYSSASAIRSFLASHWAENLSLDPSFSSKLALHIPECLHSFYETCRPVFADDFSALLNYAILRNFQEGIPFTDFEGFSPELSFRLEKQLHSGGSWTERTTGLKTKNYTYARISRCLLHLLLGVTAENAQAMRVQGYAPYARILGFQKSALPLLSCMKKSSSIPLITKTADAAASLNHQDYTFLKQDFYASHIYQAVRSGKYHITAKNEFTSPLVILPPKGI